MSTDFKLIDCCIYNKLFPEQLKEPRVIALHKEGSLDDPSNYRPRSLLPVVGKIYEKVLSQQMTKFIGKRKLISQYQFGFRRNLSSVSALNEITEFVRDTKKINEWYDMFYRSKKFLDTVDHSFLLLKPEKMGFRGKFKIY